MAFDQNAQETSGNTFTPSVQCGCAGVQRCADFRQTRDIAKRLWVITASLAPNSARLL